MSDLSDQIADAAIGNIPAQQRTLQNLQIVDVTWQPFNSGFKTLVFRVDTGADEPVVAAASQAVLDWAATQDITALAGRIAIVGFPARSPVVLGLLGVLYTPNP